MGPLILGLSLSDAILDIAFLHFQQLCKNLKFYVDPKNAHLPRWLSFPKKIKLNNKENGVSYTEALL